MVAFSEGLQIQLWQMHKKWTHIFLSRVDKVHHFSVTPPPQWKIARFSLFGCMVLVYWRYAFFSWHIETWKRIILP